MKKIFVSLAAVIFSLTAASFSHAEETLQQRLVNKIGQAVKSASRQAVPAPLRTTVLLKWWEQGTLVHRNPTYSEKGTFQTNHSCQAILCNYKNEGNAMVVTVAFDERCFQEFDQRSTAPFFVFSVYLGKYGVYTSGEREGEPYTFEMEFDKDSHKRKETVQYKKTSDGNIYTVNMPVRTAGLKATLKEIFAKEGTVSLEKAARVLTNGPKPSTHSTFLGN